MVRSGFRVQLSLSLFMDSHPGLAYFSKSHIGGPATEIYYRFHFHPGREAEVENTQTFKVSSPNVSLFLICLYLDPH